MFTWFKKKLPQIQCPNCGSTDIETYYVINNFDKALAGLENPTHDIRLRCNNCNTQLNIDN